MSRGHQHEIHVKKSFFKKPTSTRKTYLYWETMLRKFKHSTK